MSQSSPSVLNRLISLGRHHFRSLKPDSSFAGEFAHLTKLLQQLNVKSGFVVDIAASDGVRQSSTLNFFKDPAWCGLAVEMDPLKFSQLAFVYANFPNARLARGRVTPDNVTSLLRAFEVPDDFTLLNLDIDSYDLFVINEMLSGGFRPQIVSMEINEKVPPPLYFTVNFDHAHYWQMDHFFGCSITAACETVKAFGYILESLQYNNAIFIHSSVATDEHRDLDAETAYAAGYRDRADRKQLFPWNTDMEPLLKMPTTEAIDFLNCLFKKYEGRYTLKV